MPVPRKDSDDQAGQAAEAGRRTADEAARTARETTQAAAETGQRAARAGANVATELAERTWTQFAEAFGLSGQRVEQAAQQFSENVEAMTQCGGVLANGFQEISREWLSYTQDQVQRGLEGVNAVLRSRTPQDLIAAQSDLLRQSLESFLQSSVRIAELSTRIANEAAQKVASRAEESAGETRRRA